MFQRIVIISAEYELYLNNGWICVEMSFLKCSKECFLNLLYDKWKRILTPEFATSLKPYKAGLSAKSIICRRVVIFMILTGFFAKDIPVFHHFVSRNGYFYEIPNLLKAVIRL